MDKIRKNLESRKSVVICDANVYLHVYSYFPEYSDFAIKCLNAIKDYLIMPSIVALEYMKHRKTCFNNMKKRISEAKKSLDEQISNARATSLAVVNKLKKLGFEEIDELNHALEQEYANMIASVDNFFGNRLPVLELIDKAWGKEDCVLKIYNHLARNNRILIPFTQNELYWLCAEGKKRFKQKMPPGYMDNNKDGLGKYSDFIWWKEVLRYVEREHCDLFLITDDVKADWWSKDSNGEYSFREELIKEFEKTGQHIYPYTSQEFFELVGKEYVISQPDIVQYALELTDESYCERIADKAFDKIADELINNCAKYIASDTYDIGTIEVDEYELVSYQYESGKQILRDQEDVYYSLEFTVTLSGFSYEYWGRDEDTKEVITSPGIYHEFEGKIQVTLNRQADSFVDFEKEDSFEDVEITDGYLEETTCVPWYEDEMPGLEEIYSI